METYVKHCTWCKTAVEFVATKEEWDMWFSRERPSVERCFPHMSSGEREMLISGTCNSCCELIELIFA